MGDVAKISPRVLSTCAQNGILSFLIIQIIPSRQIYVAIDNQLLIPCVCCLTASSYLWNYVRAADDVFQTDNLQATAAGAVLSCNDFETGSKLPEYFGIMVTARVNQYSTTAPSSFGSVISNSGCSYHGRRPFSAPYRLPERCSTDTQSFC
jgi:hypothetical protein